MDDNKEQSKEVNLVQHKVTTTSVELKNDFSFYFTDSELIAAESFLKRLMSTPKGGIKNVNEGIALMMRAKDLQLPFSSCIEHIHVIGDKTGIDIHIIRTLLLRAGIVWEHTKDNIPLYEYTDGSNIYKEEMLPAYTIICRNQEEAEKKTNDNQVAVYPLRYYIDLKGQVFNQFQINDKFSIALHQPQAMKLAQEGKYPVIRIPQQPYDIVSEYRFERWQKVNGREIHRICTGKYSKNDAILAKLVEKDNWQKQFSNMLNIRAFTLGAREIGDDVLMGCYEINELKEFTNTPFTKEDFNDPISIQ